MKHIFKARKGLMPLLRSLSIILLTAALIAPLSGCYLLPEDEEVLAPPVVLKDPTVQEVVTEKVRRGDIVNKVKFWGTFMSPDMSDLFFTDMGRLEYVNVAYGDYVEAGDLLAKLESDDLDLQLAQLEISLKKANLNYDRLKEMDDGSDNLKYDLEDAKLNIESIENSITNLKDKLSKVSIITPVSGVVTYINPLPVGQTVPVRTTFITVSDISKMTLLVKQGQVTEPLPVGMELTVGYNGNTYVGKVAKTPEDNENEKNTNFLNAYTIDVEGLDMKDVRLNNTASIEYIIAKVENVLLIDKSYIRNDNGRTYVNVYKNGAIEEREIEVGVLSNNGVDAEITKGLTDTDEIVVQ